MKAKQLFMSVALLSSVGTLTAQNAQFSSFSYSGNDERFCQSYDAAKQYLNPILAGFTPDPSICRKGDTDYLVNSSFTFFPGVPIYKSKDLVNWQGIGHVLDRESQVPLTKQRVSGGIYAPPISYNAKTKPLYMIPTNLGPGNSYVKSKDPEKGWSEPM